MKPATSKFLAGGVAGALLAAGIAGSVFAQTPTPGASPTKPAVTARADALLNALASRLGKSADEVKAAIVAAEKDLVNQAVQDGRLTQDQATRLNERIDRGGGLGVLRGPAIGPRAGRAAFPNIQGGVRASMTSIAGFLGVQPAEVTQALRSGKSLAQLAQEKGKSRDDLKAFLTNNERTRLTAAVNANRITQAQADAMMKRFTDGLDRAIDRTVPARTKPAKPTATKTASL